MSEESFDLVELLNCMAQEVRAAWLAQMRADDDGMAQA